MIKTGCCGFQLSQKEYVKRFPLVEVQTTFYQPPRVVTLEKWRREAPEEFAFTMKAWQLITHEAKSPTYRRLKRKMTDEELSTAGAFRASPIVQEAWEVTRDCAVALRAEAVLFQCPASFTPTEEHVDSMREFFQGIDRGDLRLLWEPRGGWDRGLIADLCEELKLVHVVDPFVSETVTDDFLYFRLHGRTGFRYVYEDFELEELLEMTPGDAPAYVLFNNVRMREDGERFMALIDQVGNGG